MSDFKINASVEIDRNKADAELLKLQKQAEKKKLKVDVQIGNVAKLNSQLSQVTNVLNKAFKMDKSSLSNLKQIEDTLKQINKLGKDVQKNIFGGNSSKGATDASKGVDKLLNQYKQLINQKTALEKQMSKTTDVQSFAVLESQLVRVSAKLTNLGVDLNKLRDNDSVERSLAQTFQGLQNNITKAKTQLEKFNNTKILDEKQTSEVIRLSNELDKLSNKKLKDMNFLDMQKLSSDLSNVQKQMNNLKLPDAQSKFVQPFTGMQKQVDGLIGKLNTLSKSGYVDTSQIQRMVSDLQKIKNINLNSIDKLTLDSSISQVNKLEQEFKDVSNAAKELKFKEKLAIDTSKVQNDLTKLRKKCVEAGRSTSDIDRLERELRELSDVPMDKVPNNLAKIRNEVTQMKGSFSGLNSTVKSTNTFFSDLYRSFSTFTLGNMIGMQLQNGIRQIGQTVVELDSSFRDMMKVAPESFRGTADELDNVKDRAIEAGISVARSSNDIIQGTAKSFQMGIKNIDDAMQYATKSAQFANVADLSIEDSDKYLASIMAAYGGVVESLKPLRENIRGAGEDYNTLTKFTDLANYAGNNFAVTSGDIGTALQKSVSALSSFGTSMEDSIALTVGMQEVVQNADKTGTSLKSIAVNLAGVKAAASDGTLEANRTSKAFKELANIDIWNKQTGDIKGTMDVLSELSTQWDTLNDDAKTGIAEATAGKLHINSFVALMDNWKQVIKYQEDYKQGLTVGSAEKENERFINSIEGKLVRLQEELKKLVTTTISTDMFKNMIDGASNFLSVLNNIVTSFDKMGMTTPLVVGTLGTLFTSIKAFGTNNLKNGLIPITGISKVTSALKAQETQLVRSNGVTVSYTKGLSNLSSGVSIASRNVSKASGSYKQYSVNTTQANTSVSKLSSTISKTNKGFMSTATSMVATNAKSMLLNTGITLLNGAMIGLAVAGVSMAIKAFDNYINKAEKAGEKHKENIEAIQGDISTYNSQKVAIGDIAKEYDELSKKTGKTANDFRRLGELKGIIAETMPDLVIGYDSSNDPILKMNGSAEDLIKSLDIAIGKKQALLADEQIANGNNALDILQKNNKGMGAAHQYDDILFNATSGKIETAKKQVLAGLSSLNTESEKKYKQNLENYKEYMQDYKDTIIEENDLIRQESSRIEENLATVRQGVIAGLNKDNGFTQLNEDVKQFAYELTDSLDFSSLSKSDLSSYTSSLKRALVDGDVDNVLVKYQDLREELEKTGQYENYEKAVSSIVPELAKTLGLSQEMVENMVKVPPSMKVATDAVDSYLQSFGKRSQMASFDVETRDLIATYDMFNDLILDLSKEASLIDIDGVIQYDPKIVSDILENPGLPPEIKHAIEIMRQDGLEQEEVELLIKLATGYQFGDTELGNTLIEEAQQELDERLGDKTVDVGDIKVKANYQVQSYEKDKLEAELKEFAQFDDGRDEVKKTLILEAVGVEDVQLYADVIKNLPTNTEYTNKFIIEQIGSLQEFENYQEVIEWVKANPEIAQKYNINIENLDKFNESAKRLNELEEKKVTTYVDVEGEEEVTQATDEIIQKQSEIENKEVSLKVNKGEIQGTADDIKTLIEYSTKLEDGTYNISFKTDTAEAIQEIENFKLAINNLSNQFMNIPDVTTEIDTEQSAKNISGLIQRIKEYLESSGNIKPITFIANTEQAAKNISGLIQRIKEVPTGTKTLTYNVQTNYLESGKKSIPTPQPQVFEQQVVRSVIDNGNEIALLSESSVTETVANTSVEQLNVRARAKNPISTMDSLNYKVNALKNLENQLKKISNELELIDEKSKNAFGQDKIKYLERQIVLYQKQQSIQHQLAESMRKQQADLKNYLSGKGIKFGDNGDVLNYAEKLLAIEKEIEKLNKQSSDDRNNRDKNKTPVDNSAALDNLNKQKEMLETYLDLTFNKIPSASKEWWNLANAIKENNKEIEKIRYDAIFEPLKNKLKEVEHALDRVNDKMDLLDKLNNRANGSKKLSYLQKKINLLKEEQSVLGEMDKAIKDQILSGQKEIGKFGFKIDGSSLITNYDEILNGLVGTEKYEDAKKAAEDYIDLVRNKLPDAWKDWLDIENTIKDIQDEIEKLERQMKLFEANSKLKELSMQFDEIADKLSIIDEKMKHAYGKDKLDLIEQQLALLEQQKALQDEIIKGHQSKLNTYQSDLGKYGFTFSDTGTVENLDEILNKYKDHDDIEKITELVDEYIRLQRDELPDAVLEWEKLNNAIKDTYKEQLNTAKEIEDKITQMYKKQIQDRIDAMNKETEAKKKALQQQKDDYNKSRQEADYKDEYDDKMAEVSDLEKQLQISMKDTSLNGQKKVKELQKLLAAAQKELDKLTQNKIDSDVNDAFDKESDRIEEDNKQNIEELEKEWSDSKIAELVSQALGSGVFTDIEGNVSSLEDALVNFAEETGDLFGVLGSVIKDELIGNLAIAQDAVRDLAEILKTLDIEKSIPKLSAMSFSPVVNPMSSARMSPNVTFDSPLIVVEGNVDSNVMEDLKDFGNKLKDDIFGMIAKRL